MFRMILGMSEYLKEIRRDLTPRGKQVLRHIIKLVLYPDVQEYEHWKKEIFNFISDVDKVKGKNKWPDAKFIYESISTQNDMIDVIIKQIKLMESEYTPRDVDDATVLKAVESYQNWLAASLSKQGAIDPNDAFALLDTIVERTRR